MTVASWGTFTDPASQFELAYRTGTVYTFHNTPGIDAELDTLSTIVEDDKRIAQIKKINRMVSEDANTIWLYHEMQYYGINDKKVKTFKQRKMDGHTKSFYTIEMRE